MNAVQRAKEIVAATEWEGDLRVNMTTVIGAGRVLAKRIEELELVLYGGVCNFQGQPCGECQQCKKVRDVLASR